MGQKSNHTNQAVPAASRAALYLQLLRPRTLPLAVAAMFCAAALAHQYGRFNGAVFVLSLLTAVALQVVSNIANDYGDGLRGTDTARAVDAPRRVTASGALSPARVRACLIGSVMLAVLCGLCLLVVAWRSWQDTVLFLGLGAVALAAALAYTLGRFAYGYRALGEFAVLVFFGWLAVGGSFYLHTGMLPLAVLVPASGCGLLAAAVLHLNNMRDLHSDKQAGKRTLAGIFGFAGSKQFHAVLLIAGIVSYSAYDGFQRGIWLYLLLLLPQLSSHLYRVFTANTCAAVGQQLPAVVSLHAGANMLFALMLWLQKLPI